MRWIARLLPAALVVASAWGGDDLFEAEIRPLFAQNCYACHSADAEPLFADLRLDTAAGARSVVVPGDPAASKLVQALHGRTLQMPPTGKLPADQIAAVENWIRSGAPVPDEAPTSAPDPSAAFDLEARRASHWAWRPVESQEPPPVEDESWPLGAIDRFLLAKLEAEGLEPSRDADRRTFIRRLTFALTGLPPTPDEIEAFLNDASPDAYETLVDRLLASPHYGERQARRWMDLMRYAESHGSEGDPDTVNAWRYRDYLIRAFNQDLPYDQLIREHLAGDLLAEPRVDPALGINESRLATAHFRLIEHGFQPVNPWEDRVKWTDNQIDVFSKAFQGLTVSCARCHDHKFDAISQKDYYALFGVMKNVRPTQREIDSPARLTMHHERLAELKGQIRAALADAWRDRAATLAEDLLAGDVAERGGWDASNPLHPWTVIHRADDTATAWKALRESWRLEQEVRRAHNAQGFDFRWNLADEQDFDAWLGHGSGLPDAPSKPGAFAVEPTGPRAVTAIHPAGVYTHLLSEKRAAVLQSPRFEITSDSISLRMAGGNFSNAQLIIENYAVPRAGIYHLRYRPKSSSPEWFTWKTDYWKGFTAYFEFATYGAYTHFQHDPEDSGSRPRPQPDDDGRSWFGAGQVVFHDGDAAPQDTLLPIRHVLEASEIGSREGLAALYQRLLTEAVDAWGAGRMTDEQAAFLDFFVREDLLPTRVDELDAVADFIAEYRRLEREIPEPRFAPGVVEEGGPPQRLLVRGNLDNFGDPVPQRYLTALGCEAIADPARARLEIAERLTSPDNPLTARVMVNRLWRSLFGAGIVRTVDNFGALGEEPSHPELLDYLADRFVREGWSIKALLREMALTRAYRMSSDGSEKGSKVDPENRLLSHFSVRRLEAEEMRDAMLAISGRLDPEAFGPSIPIYYAHDTGKTKGDTEKGPLDGDGRRSVYQEIRRNTANPFLEVFDQPTPSTTRGRRDVTNVPAQSLTLLNSPFVIGQAAEWSERLVATEDASAGERIERMWTRALGRPPSAPEKDRAETYVAALAEERGEELLDSRGSWQDLAQTLFNLKEFLFVR